MSDDERAIVDQTGRFLEVVVDGTKRNDLEWSRGRILLSNRRLVCVGSEQKRTIPLSTVTTVKSGSAFGQEADDAASYVSVRTGDDVVLVAPADLEGFVAALFGALVDREPVLVNHPAVAGGVVQDETWESGRVSAGEGTLDVALSSGTFVEIDVDDVGRVETTTRSVDGTNRPVVEAEHTEDGTTAVETHLAAGSRTVNVVASYLRRGEQQNAVDVDLSDAEQEVLLALYSGVSPFQIPSFVGRDVDEVEAIFEHLVDLELLEPVRTRREVELEARGRSIASDAMTDQ